MPFGPLQMTIKHSIKLECIYWRKDELVNRIDDTPQIYPVDSLQFVCNKSETLAIINNKNTYVYADVNTIVALWEEKHKLDSYIIPKVHSICT